MISVHGLMKNSRDKITEIDAYDTGYKLETSLGIHIRRKLHFYKLIDYKEMTCNIILGFLC